jgi:uncharacterized RDD family membrane protein YckC
MDDRNPYSAPESALTETAATGHLADYGERLAAALIDVLLMLAISLPLMWFGRYFHAVFEAAMAGRQPPFLLTLQWSLVGFLVFLLVQGYPLHRSGQTWGKRVLRIRIVDLQGQMMPLLPLLLRRYLPLQIAAVIPFLGNLLALVNVLLIFRQDRRCGHDLIAGTRVIKAGRR